MAMEKKKASQLVENRLERRDGPSQARSTDDTHVGDVGRHLECCFGARTTRSQSNGIRFRRQMDVLVDAQPAASNATPLSLKIKRDYVPKRRPIFASSRRNDAAHLHCALRFRVTASLVTDRVACSCYLLTGPARDRKPVTRRGRARGRDHEKRSGRDVISSGSITETATFCVWFFFLLLLSPAARRRRKVPLASRWRRGPMRKRRRAGEIRLAPAATAR